ncbi:hypothetical protein C823_005820 [Eubacterium plexicaudatum ASF492]|nr:hypothetical protein C823_000601 [Eubacterium plexicaudatum ASF492]KAI4451271.1 hypothetical protein C823_005820 [Eubacterium plexicaudatum ASF492]
MQLEAGNQVVIFFCEMGLQESTKIVIINISVWVAYAANYTKTCGIPQAYVIQQEAKLWSGRFLLLFILQLHKNDNRRHSIKQSAAKCNRLIYAVPSVILTEIQKNNPN